MGEWANEMNKSYLEKLDIFFREDGFQLHAVLAVVFFFLVEDALALIVVVREEDVHEVGVLYCSKLM